MPYSDLRRQKKAFAPGGPVAGPVLPLNNGCPGATVVPASMQATVELDGIELLVHDALDNLPNGLKQAGSVVVTTAFWDQDYNDPAELLGYRARLPDCSDQLHQQVLQVPRAVIALTLLSVFFPPYPLEPLLDVLSMHHQSASAASVGQVARGVPHFRFGGRAIQNWNGSDVYGEGLLWGGPSRIQCNPFCHLAFHPLKALPYLDFRCSTVPSFEVPKCLLDVSSPELGFNGSANLFSSGGAVVP
jgi:hypothetical protein